MIFEPAHLKSAGNKSSQISSTFQHVVYFQIEKDIIMPHPWVRTSQTVENIGYTFDDLFQKPWFKNHLAFGSVMMVIAQFWDIYTVYKIAVLSDS